MVTSLGYPELAVTVETMGGHVVGHPPCDLHREIHIRRVCAVIRGDSGHAGEGEKIR